MATASILEVPPHRACAQCRTQKVRCLRDESDLDAGCQRCVRLGRHCANSPVHQRKQRKRTDTRVAKLEREMRAMRAMLKQKQEDGRAPSQSTTHVHEDDRESNTSLHWAPGASTNTPSKATGKQIRAKSTANDDETQDQEEELLRNDVIQRGLLSMETARQLFASFKDVSLPQFPFLVLRETAESIRHDKPVLFLAILAAAAIGDDDELATVLGKEVLSTYASRVLIQSEKSLELVQALLLSALWYQPPTRFGQLKYYEFLQMAVTIAIALGIERPPVPRNADAAQRSTLAQQATLHPAEDANNPDLSMTPRIQETTTTLDTVESSRTYLALYIACSGMAMSLRRPCILPMSKNLRKHMDHLSKAPSTLASDRTLEYWTKLMMITEELAASLHFDEPGSVVDLHTRLMIKDFTRRLSDWYTSVPGAHWTDAMRITYRAARLYTQEPMLYVENSPSDFRAPYRMGSIATTVSTVEVPTLVLGDALAELIINSHALLRDFLAVNVDSLRVIPIFVYVRVSYAAFILAKLCLSAASPGSRIGKALEQTDLNTQEILDRVILHVRAADGSKHCRVPALMMALIFKLRRWCLQPGLLVRVDETDAPSSFPERPSALVSQADAVNMPEASTVPHRTAELTKSSAREPFIRLSASAATGVCERVRNSDMSKDGGTSKPNFTMEGATNSRVVDDGVPESLGISVPGEALVSHLISESPTMQWNQHDDTYNMQLDEDFAQFAHSMVGFNLGSLEDINLGDEWI